MYSVAWYLKKESFQRSEQVRMEYVMVAITVAFAATDSYNYIWDAYILADASHLNHTGFSTDQI